MSSSENPSLLGQVAKKLIPTKKDKDYKAILKDWAMNWNVTRDKTKFYDLFAEDCNFISLAEFGLEPTKKGFQQFFDPFLEAFDGLQITIDEQIAEDNIVMCRVTEKAMHTGTWQGIAATNKTIEFEEWIIFSFNAENKVVQWRYLTNMLKLFTILGVQPS